MLRIVTWCLKAESVQSEKTAIVRKQQAKKLSHINECFSGYSEPGFVRHFRYNGLQQTKTCMLDGVFCNRSAWGYNYRPVQDPDNCEGLVLKKDLNVWTIIIECNCNWEVQQIHSSNLESTIICHAYPLYVTTGVRSNWIGVIELLDLRLCV
jgi:hypothetical protein